MKSNNPKHYWKLVYDIKGSITKKKKKIIIIIIIIKKTTSNSSCSQIDSDTWVNHFRNLYSNIDNSFWNRINELENILKKKEKKAIFSELDFEIIEEIINALSKLKVGRAVGSDLISNEILKCSQNYLIPCLGKLFNTCFKNGFTQKCG
jgi:hypothetical protein